ncbi:cbb3-type cytochrome c oxidase N-terminal domain-containing protein [Schleiferia thermophila]|uniref:Cytochrome c oxidase cbb3-type subunit 3 n=1 Tax=Schleiferia thermophila TaxID=884107 RepID=A0A369A1Z5_9FLAO|nr:cbb3-type cytochrome c oxidase N-terminal domain-containing protein [Schleiferia thermophila]RCX03211.1 cytochrome c oxidase cbb3-type subunit 3 [Schleiferia thermophila]GCD80338.1 cytochrome c oxidase subunit III [Schleiferia thermophila]
MKKIPLFFLLLFGPVAMAQEQQATAGFDWYSLLNDLFFWMFFITFVLLILTLVTVNRAFNAIKELMTAQKNAIQSTEVEAEEQVMVEARPSLYQRIMYALTKAKPIEKEADIMLDHDYDGIKELDNSLPPWWVWGFYITIIYSVIYLLHFHVLGTGPSSIEELERELALAEKQKEEYLKTAANLIDENNVQYLTAEANLANGRKIYEQNCPSCHAIDGGGLVGPNLTDDYYIHGGSIQDIFKVIKYGVLEKGMLAWKDMLSPAQMQDVASYVKSLKGTTPANPKEPQGTLYVEDENLEKETSENTTESEQLSQN